MQLAQAALANNRGFFSTTGQVDQERVRVLREAIDAYEPGDSAVRARARRLAADLDNPTPTFYAAVFGAHAAMP